MNALRIEGLGKRFGGVDALIDVSLSVEAGERRVLIGPNGAGKTTLFHSIAGSQLPTEGHIMLFGDDVTRLPAYRRAQRGLARTFQITNLFPTLSVEENVLLSVAAAQGIGERLVRPMYGYRAAYERCARLLDDFGLSHNRNRQARHLSYGEQRELELALVLAGSPRVLLLDEPMAGLSGAEAARAISLIQALPRQMTILLIEHDMDVAFELADSITVMHQGRIVAEGDEKAIRANPHVADIYLGVV